MILGYNTNGFPFHRLGDTLEILAEIGYGAVGITLDYHCLNPFDADVESQAEILRKQLDRLKLRCVVETGARFLLDPRQKHQPTLLSRDESSRAIRIDFLKRSLRIAELLSADCVSLWSGTSLSAESTDVLLARLCDGVENLLATAEVHGIPLAFEPEPGMFIATVADLAPLFRRFDHALFGATLDVGHIECQSEGEFGQIVESIGPKLLNVHLDDSRAGKHDHLMFGEGTVDFEKLFSSLRKLGYNRGAYVELSRHGHDAVESAGKSWQFLAKYFAEGGRSAN